MLSHPHAVPLGGKLATKWCHPLELDQRGESDPEGSLTQYIYRDIDVEMSGWKQTIMVDAIYHAGVDG